MNANKLMIPRFEIIADYPNLSYNVGRIIEPVKEGSNYYDCFDAPSNNLICNPNKYPHLFKKLN